MGLDDIDIDSWGKLKRTAPKKRVAEADEDGEEKAAPRAQARPARGLNLATMKPKREVPLDEVPIDALRGLYYLTLLRSDKKQSKADLKHALRELLSSSEKFEQLLQHIVDVLMS